MNEEDMHLINKIFNLEENLGEIVINKDNRLNYEYKEQKQIENEK